MKMCDSEIKKLSIISEKIFGNLNMPNDNQKAKSKS